MNNTSATLTVEVWDRATAIGGLPRELDDLSGRALEPNVFNESLMFIAALRRMDVHIPLWIVCIRGPAGILLGVVAMVVAPVRRSVPAMVLRNWVHRNCFLGTPILDAHFARQVLEALAAWIESGAAPAGGIEWVKVSWDGPFGQLVRQVFSPSRSWKILILSRQRAMLERAQDMKASISGKHAKELRRLERRLASHGSIAYAVMQPADDWQAWFDEFLAVEASGWKGAEGSAIRSRPEDAAFFREVIQRAHASGQLQLLRMSVAGKAVAMKLNLRARGMSYSLKIGYDETYAQYSPGLLLELFNIKAFELEPDGILSMDSCAPADHPMISRLWSARREIATVTLIRRGVLLHIFAKLRPMAQRLKRTLFTKPIR